MSKHPLGAWRRLLTGTGLVQGKPTALRPARQSASSSSSRRSGMRGCDSPGCGRITAPGSSWPQSTRIVQRGGAGIAQDLAAARSRCRLRRRHFSGLRDPGPDRLCREHGCRGSVARPKTDRYKVPERVWFRRTLPKNVGGKLERGLLREQSLRGVRPRRRSAPIASLIINWRRGRAGTPICYAANCRRLGVQSGSRFLNIGTLPLSRS
jgi:hypothetical protein